MGALLPPKIPLVVLSWPHLFNTVQGSLHSKRKDLKSPQSSTVLQDTQALNLYSSSIIGRLLVIHACRQKYIKDDM